MIASAHVLAGLICGVAAASARASGARVVAAFALGVASHVILDAIPHSDYGVLSRSTIVAVVAMEVVATIAFAWFLLHRREVAGWRTALPAGVAGASIPDIKFVAPLLPDPASTWTEEAANRFHGPFHAWPAPLGVEILLELVCTLLLACALVVVVRREAAVRSTLTLSKDPRRS
jgi:hypothetical protein